MLAITENLPGLLKDFHETGGENHRDLWESRFEDVMKSWESIQSKQTLVTAFSEDMVIVQRSWNAPPVSPYALHRKLKEEGIELTTQRVLHVLTDVTGARFKYEKAGHGWVSKLVERPSLKRVDAKKLVEGLNKKYQKANWKAGGDELISICQSFDITTDKVEDVADYLLEHDEGLVVAEEEALVA